MLATRVRKRVAVPVVYGRSLAPPSSVALFAHRWRTLLGIVERLLALPVARGILISIEELRVDCQARQNSVRIAELRKRDDVGEQEYERRTEGMPVEQAAPLP